MPRPRKNSTENTKKVSSSNYLERLENEIQSNQSKVSLILGALIVLVIGILVFNYFNRNQASLGPAQQTQTTQQSPQPDVAQDKLPGPYTVKDGDTLFTIAEKYYADGNKFEDIAKANNLTNPDEIIVGQILQISKLDSELAQVSPTSSPQPSSSSGTGGGNTTIWGPRIEENTYTVVENDWLSKIAGRAYGDVMAYERIAQANNISNPDHIEPGMVLTIPK